MPTEAVADRMWCPMSVDVDSKCLGSACMGWRWDRKHNDQLIEDARMAFRESADYEAAAMPVLSDSAEWEAAMRDRLGWCGMAGKDDE